MDSAVEYANCYYKVRATAVAIRITMGLATGVALKTTIGSATAVA